MLRGYHWARWVFVLYFGYNVIGNVVRGPLLLILPGLLFGLAVFFLFRPQANAFFRGDYREELKGKSSDQSNAT